MLNHVFIKHHFFKCNIFSNKIADRYPGTSFTSTDAELKKQQHDFKK